MRSIIHACLLLCFAVPSAFAATSASDQVQGVYKFIQRGNINIAISTAKALLKDTKTSAGERLGLLQALGEAEYVRAAAGGYQSISEPIKVYRSLIKEYPNKIDIAKLKWKMAWLYWNHHDPEQADAAAQTILQEYPSSPEVRKAALLRARILIKKGRYSDARFLLLEHFGLGAAVGSRQEAEGIAWMGVVDFYDHRLPQAWISMQRASSMAPKLIKEDPTLYATYVQLLARQNQDKKALKDATDFVSRYITAPDAPTIRLLRADLLDKRGSVAKAKELYGILANSYADSSVGKKALIRQMMLNIGKSTDPARLKAAVRALNQLAAANQLSDIEAEARLDEGRLMARLGAKDLKYSDAAIAYYAMAAASVEPEIVPIAMKEASVLLDKRLQDLLNRQAWLQAVLLWKRYPQMRPNHDAMIVFGIARAYAHLTDYTHAEALYQGLYKQADGTLLGQRIMLEMSRLWMHRGDRDGPAKVMHWLADHAGALYGNEMRLTVAQMLIKQGKFATAEKAIAGIQAQNLSPHMLPAYWHATAALHVAMKQWHDAAVAWATAASYDDGNAHWRDVRAQAEAMIQGGDYAAASQALNTIPAAKQDAGWSFAMALCNQHTGHWDDAEAQLQQLANASPANAFSLRAQMVLANHQVGDLEKTWQEMSWQ